MSIDQKEIYASFEIRDSYLNFIVLYYDESHEYNVLFEKHLEGKYSENGLITNPKIVAKDIKSIIEEANKQLFLKITRVGLVLPNQKLKILKNIKTKKFESKKQILKEDIEKLLLDNASNYTSKEEYIASISPYAYTLDKLEKTKQLLPPIGVEADFLTINCLIYTIDKEVYKTHLNALKLAKLKLLSITTKSYSLGYSTGSKIWYDNFVMIDWNESSVDISIFLKQKLVTFKSFEELGINNFINKISSEFKIDFLKAKKYLYNVFNSEVISSTKSFTIHKYLDDNKQLVKISMKDLLNEFHKYCNNTFNVVNKFILSQFKDLNKDKSIDILCTGDIIKINDFEKAFARQNDFNYKLYKSNLIGVQDVWSIPIIGNIIHQRFKNKLEQKLITSIYL